MERSLNDRTLVWAHRGASAYAPENTLPAFALAAELNADGVELDVHLSKDGYVVVHHDFNIYDPAIGQSYIRDLTLEEVKRFNCNNPEKYPDLGFVPAPTLDEVYDLLEPTGLTVNVELKSGEDELLGRCIALAKDKNMSERVHYSSFNHVTLQKLYELDGTVSTAPLYTHRLAKVWDYVKLYGANSIHPDWGQIYDIPELISQCHATGVRVNPWTVDSEEQMKKLTELGVDALITDLPDVALRIVKEVYGK